MSYKRVSDLDPDTILGFQLVSDLVEDALDEGQFTPIQEDWVRRALRMINRRARASSGKGGQ